MTSNCDFSGRFATKGNFPAPTLSEGPLQRAQGLAVTAHGEPRVTFLGPRYEVGGLGGWLDGSDGQGARAMSKFAC